MAANKLTGLLIGVPIVLVVGALIIVGMIFFSDSNSKQRSATAEAEVVSAVPFTWTERRKTKNGYSVSYRFKTADGQTISDFDERNTLYQPGFKFRVCYDPQNPTDSELRHPTRGTECGKGLLF